MITHTTLCRLEFNKVLQSIASHARSDITAHSIMAMQPSRQPQEIRTGWQRIEEIRGLLRQRICLRISRFSDIRPLLDAVRPSGAILSPFELLEFIPVLSSLAELARQLAPREDIPALKLLSPFPVAFNDILEPLAATLDDEGNILDSASQELSQIRKAKRTLAARVRKKLEEFVRRHETAIFLQDDFITIRSGRWVIPVRMDSKGMVREWCMTSHPPVRPPSWSRWRYPPLSTSLKTSLRRKGRRDPHPAASLSLIREDAEQIGACFKAWLSWIAWTAWRRLLKNQHVGSGLNQNGSLRCYQPAIRCCW